MRTSTAGQTVVTRATDSVTFYGHESIKATHSTTLEITKDRHLTERADCVIGVRADKGCVNLEGALRSVIRQDHTLLSFRLEVGDLSCEWKGRGSSRLSLSSNKDIVLRKSAFVSDRTLAVNCELAARDLPRRVVELLRNPKSVARLVIVAIGPTAQLTKV